MRNFKRKFAVRSSVAAIGLFLLALAFSLGHGSAVAGAKPGTGQAKCGDVNGDGSVNSIDAVYVMQVGAGLLPDTLEVHRIADVTLDGEVDVSDAREILRHAARHGPKLECGTFLRVGSASRPSGGMVSIPVYIHNAVTGLSGATVVVEIEDPGIATINAVRLPRFPINVVEGDLPAGAAEVSLVDTTHYADGEFLSQKLFTLRVRVISEGTTGVTLNAVRIDDDDGYSLLDRAILVSGSVTGTN